MNIDITKDKLACFIHSTTLKLWKESFLVGLLNTVKDSGLLLKLNAFYIVNTGEYIQSSQEIERDFPPAKVIYYSKDTMDFENSTIRLLHFFTKLHPDHKILYMHTKGISYTENHVFFRGVQSWNNYMKHCLVDNYKKCLRLLKIYDTVGTNFRPSEDGNGQHFSGNFWWANADYIQKLPIEYLKDKYHPEFWLLQNNPLFHNIHTIENMYQQVYPLENYKECVQRGFDDKVIFCKVGFYCTSLCNQLYNIANSIVLAAAHTGNKVIILDDFVSNAHIEDFRTIPTTHVLDLLKMNNYWNNYGIHLIYKKNVSMKLSKVEYGLRETKTIDITNLVNDNFMKDNHLFIPKFTNLNDLIGSDPCPLRFKQIYVHYTLNGIPLFQMFHESKLIGNNSIEIKHSNYDEKKAFHNFGESNSWLTRIDIKDAKEMKSQFLHALTKIYFLKSYHTEADKFVEVLLKNKKTINVWHVRNENDAIGHWCKLNKIPESEYKEIYENKYINFVRQKISKESTNIVLTSFVEQNPIIETLREDGFQIYVRPNIPDIGREINGLIDLLIGLKCNNIFISNYDSTFSAVLFNNLKETVKTYAINLSSITEDVCILDKL